jgi:hypothetical protein
VGVLGVRCGAVRLTTPLLKSQGTPAPAPTHAVSCTCTFASTLHRTPHTAHRTPHTAHRTHTPAHATHPLSRSTRAHFVTLILLLVIGQRSEPHSSPIASSDRATSQAYSSIPFSNQQASQPPAAAHSAHQAQLRILTTSHHSNVWSSNDRRHLGAEQPTSALMDVPTLNVAAPVFTPGAGARSNAPPVAREPSPMRSSSSASGQDTPVRDQRPSLHSNMVGVQHILAPLRFALGSC